MFSLLHPSSHVPTGKTVLQTRLILFGFLFLLFYVLLYEPVNTVLLDSISHTTLSPKSDQYQISPRDINAL